MTYGSQEFIDLRECFEQSLKHMPVASGRADRADRSTAPPSVFYDDGRVNELFHAYMYGYQFGRSVYMS